MANHSSTKKSIKQTIKRTLINKSRNSKIKTFIKNVEKEISNHNVDAAKNNLSLLQSQIMKGVKKGIWNLNAASRKVSKLSAKIKQLTA